MQSGESPTDAQPPSDGWETVEALDLAPLTVAVVGIIFFLAPLGGFGLRAWLVALGAALLAYVSGSWRRSRCESAKGRELQLGAVGIAAAVAAAFVVGSALLTSVILGPGQI